MTIGERILEMRREKGATQEQLAQAVGVSAQAVSKWENGGVPDSMTLIPLANYFGVTTDELLGRETAPKVDLFDALMRDIAGRPCGERFSRMLAFAWAMQRGYFGCVSDGDTSEKYRSTERMDSQSASFEGVSLVRMGASLDMAILMPKPAKGWKNALRCEEALALFQFLSEEDAYNALLLLYARGQEAFTMKLFMKKLGVDAARAEAMLAQFVRWQLVTETTLEIDDDRVRIYAARPNPYLLPLIACARQIVDPPHCFTFSSNNYEQPFLREESE